ncbi:MAG: hypothetical protein KDA89_01865 [Planctomycetaceae bacterium]|nr:hypothetical protein [Planctomycetaceae bacterium]
MNCAHNLFRRTLSILLLGVAALSAASPAQAQWDFPLSGSVDAKTAQKITDAGWGYFPVSADQTYPLEVFEKTGGKRPKLGFRMLIAGDAEFGAIVSGDATIDRNGNVVATNAWVATYSTFDGLLLGNVSGKFKISVSSP